MITSIDLQKLEIFGRSYIFDSIINQYNDAKINQSYRNYMADCLLYMVKFYSGQDLPRWQEEYEHMMPSKKPERSGKQIINNMKRKFEKWLGSD